MGKKLNLVGMKFGQLTVLSEAGSNKHKKVCWLCKCECGNLTTVPGSHLKNNHTTSCGCLSPIKYIHGGYANKERLCLIWSAMKRRCYKSSFTGYENYGGRGITVCGEWLNDYKSFKNWALKNGYKEGLEIDRIDVNGNYEPVNCRWVFKKIQNNNKRSSHFITFRSETKTAAEWATITGINYQTIMSRINKFNWPIEKALTMQAKQNG